LEPAVMTVGSNPFREPARLLDGHRRRRPGGDRHAPREATVAAHTGVGPLTRQPRV
jgi:hypothetical protein